MVLTVFRNILRDKPLQMIAVHEIGKWAAHAFSHPDNFMYREIEIASDEINYQQLREVYKRVFGKEQNGLAIWPPLIGGGNKMFKWFRENRFEADLEYCRQTVKDTTTFEQWLMLYKLPA